MKYFSPAGAVWSVTRFDDGITGVVDARPWCFHADGSFDAGAEWRGIYRSIPDSNNAYDCKVFAPEAGSLTSATEDAVDQFVIDVLSEENFVATKDNKLYLFGSRTDDLINLMVVIDAKSFSDAGGQRAGFMFTEIDRAITGNGTARLQLRASPGDLIRMSAISTDNQMNNTVFVYDVKHRGGHFVFDTSALRRQMNSVLAVRQLTSQENHAPPNVELIDQTFYNCVVPISGAGTEELDILFVLYGPPVPSERQRNYLGEFTWPVSITICSEDKACT